MVPDGLGEADSPYRMNSEDSSTSHDEELGRLREELASVKADYQAAVERSLSLEEQFLATEELLQRTREKAKLCKRKRIEADHYKALLHGLRKRWYLRPFIPQGKLRPPDDEGVDCWRVRGPRFAGPAKGSGEESPRRRILVVGHLLSPMLFGSENSLLDTLAAIDPSRFDVFVVFPQNNETIFAALESRVQGIAVIDYVWWRFGPPAPEETVAAFEALLRQQAINLVHVNTIMVRDPLVAARRLGIPAITHARELISLDDDLAIRLGATPEQIVREVCQNATHILANSAATLAEYPCGDRGSFLYNSVDQRSFDFPNVVDPRCIEVGMISSNIRKKGVLDFFELARMAGETSLALRFHLIGPETALVREWRANQSALPPNVQLHDYVSPPAAAYRDLNIVINLSRFGESFGRTVAEAMVARRPVVAYRHGALSELIDDGETGFLVPYLDLPAVLNRLRFFAETPARIAEFGERARQRNAQRFSREILSRGINALYERLIAEARRSR